MSEPNFDSEGRRFFLRHRLDPDAEALILIPEMTGTTTGRTISAVLADEFRLFYGASVEAAEARAEKAEVLSAMDIIKGALWAAEEAVKFGSVDVDGSAMLNEHSAPMRAIIDYVRATVDSSLAVNKR